jgi:hypothetical protein
MDVLSTALWILFLSVVFFAFRGEIRGLFRAVLGRLHGGAAMKIGAVEIGAVIAIPSRIEKTENLQTFRDDEDKRRKQERESYYKKTRRIMLVHKLFPSTESGELYDILIYLIPAFGGTLASVQRVEYYFGGLGWKHKIFSALDRSRGFPVLTAAYGPFLCTAEVFFNDGESVMVHRFIDFEMGHAVGPTADIG